MKCKIIIKHKSKLENAEIFVQNLENKIEKYLNEGYEVKASNMTTDRVYTYIYVLMVKE